MTCLILLLLVMFSGQSVLTPTLAQEECKTSGGYVSENKPCVLPFAYTNPVTLERTVFDSCAPFGAGFDPYSSAKNSRAPRKAQFGVFTKSWCPLVSEYSPGSKGFRKEWGYCNCGGVDARNESLQCEDGLKQEPCAFAPFCGGGSLTYSQAEEECSLRGARLCSVAELVDFKLGLGACSESGKSADPSVWTLDACIELPQSVSPRYVASGTGTTNKVKCTGTTNNQKVTSIRCCKYPKVQRKRSVLMIIADDLRTDLMRAYGRKLSYTPALDAFVSDPRTIVFEKAYANYAQCSPSRLSFLTGLSPDTTGSAFVDEWKNSKSPNTMSLPEFFTNQGFTTLTGGKVFHSKNGKGDDAGLWSETYEPFRNQYTFGNSCKHPKAKSVLLSTNFPAAPGMLCQTTASPEALVDFVLEKRASHTLTRLALKPDVPFFLVVGFYKPHMPWVIHKNYWNLLPQDTPNEQVAGPEPRSSYLPIFYDTDASLSGIGGNTSPWGYSAIVPDFVRVVRKAYSAAVSQTDSRIQVLLDRLDQLNMASTTLVVIFGDHGFNLGENGLWNKDTLFETALRVPLLIRVPWAIVPRTPAPIRRATSHFVELLDLYRTIAGLMGFAKNVGSGVEGRDFSKYIMKHIETLDVSSVTAANESYAQVRRCGSLGGDGTMISKDCLDDRSGRASPITWMGYSVRNIEWRYTIWLNAPDGAVDWSRTLGEELYDHRNDKNSLFDYTRGVSYDVEPRNVAAQNPEVKRRMLRLIETRFKRIKTV